MAPDFVDDRSGIVLLFLGGQPFALVEHKPRLFARGFPLLRLWDRRDEFGAASALDDLLCGLSSLIKLPVPRWVLVGRI